MTTTTNDIDAFEDSVEATEHFEAIDQHIRDAYESFSAAFQMMRDRRAKNWAKLTEYHLGGQMASSLENREIEAAGILCHLAYIKGQRPLSDILADAE